MASLFCTSQLWFGLDRDCTPCTVKSHPEQDYPVSAYADLDFNPSQAEGVLWILQEENTIMSKLQNMLMAQFTMLSELIFMKMMKRRIFSFLFQHHETKEALTQSVWLCICYNSQLTPLKETRSPVRLLSSRRIFFCGILSSEVKHIAWLKWTKLTMHECIWAYIFRVKYGPRFARFTESTYLPSRRRSKYDEVNRAHREPIHKENIRRYSHGEVIIVLLIDPWLFFGVWKIESEETPPQACLSLLSNQPHSHSPVDTGACRNTWSMTCRVLFSAQASFESQTSTFIKPAAGGWHFLYNYSLPFALRVRV